MTLRYNRDGYPWLDPRVLVLAAVPAVILWACIYAVARLTLWAAAGLGWGL